MADEVSDPLLDELNGKILMPPLAPGETAPVQGPTRDAQLTVGTPPPVSKTAAADAIHATAAGGAGYRVTVKGEYYATDPVVKGKVKKPYQESFNVVRLEGCLSVIKNKLLKLALRKKDPNFTADRTCRIVGYVPLNASVPKSNNLAYMNREDLEAFVRSSSPRVPIDPSVEVYPDTTHLREAIIDYVQNPEGFVAREAERQAERAEERALDAMNPGLNVGA